MMQETKMMQGTANDFLREKGEKLDDKIQIEAQKE